MLVLSRKEPERIVIGKDIVLTVCRVHGNRVQLGIHAPREVRVLRGELKSTAARSNSSYVRATKATKEMRDET